MTQFQVDYASKGRSASHHAASWMQRGGAPSVNFPDKRAKQFSSRGDSARTPDFEHATSLVPRIQGAKLPKL